LNIIEENTVLRKRFYEQFKAELALEAIKEEQTLEVLPDKYQVHPSQISALKKKVLEQASILLKGKNKKR